VSPLQRTAGPGLGESCKLPSWVWSGAPASHILAHFKLKRVHSVLLLTIPMQDGGYTPRKQENSTQSEMVGVPVLDAHATLGWVPYFFYSRFQWSDNMSPIIHCKEPNDRFLAFIPLFPVMYIAGQIHVHRRGGGGWTLFITLSASVSISVSLRSPQLTLRHTNTTT